MQLPPSDYVRVTFSAAAVDERRWRRTEMAFIHLSLKFLIQSRRDDQSGFIFFFVPWKLFAGSCALLLSPSSLPFVASPSALVTGKGAGCLHKCTHVPPSFPPSLSSYFLALLKQRRGRWSEPNKRGHKEGGRKEKHLLCTARVSYPLTTATNNKSRLCFVFSTSYHCNWWEQKNNRKEKPVKKSGSESTICLK